MNWKAVVELFIEHPVKMVAATVVIVSTTLYVGNWIWDAEDCHAQAKEDQKTVEQLVEFQRGVVAEKEADAKAQRQLMQERAKLCLTKKLKDPDLCATVGIAVE